MEHLYNCARRIFRESAHERIKQWAAPLKELLYEGRASEVCDRLLFEACKYKKHETVIRELYLEAARSDHMHRASLNGKSSHELYHQNLLKVS